jgi:hypothetical protein
MASGDWAISVGIETYLDQNLRGLLAPEGDATAFHQWVTAKDGGNVPRAQAILIKSSNYPAFSDKSNAKPTADLIKAAFDTLFDVAAANAKAGKGRKVGRRLYLFFAGHGFAPDQQDELVALLTADASLATSELSHVIGSYFADTFWRARFFDEIVMFVDCCRNPMDCAQLYAPYPVDRAQDYHKVRRFYAFGAPVAKESREWKMADGKYHGAFTATVLDALSGAGYDRRNPAEITAESLRDRLYNGYVQFESPADRQRIDLSHEPDVDYKQKPGEKFVIARRGNALEALLKLIKPPQVDVTIAGSPGRIGMRAKVFNKALAEIATLSLAACWVVSVEMGFY